MRLIPGWQPKQRSTKSLYQRHGIGVSYGLLETGLVYQVNRQCAVHDTQDLTHNIRLAGKEKPKGVWDAGSGLCGAEVKVAELKRAVGCQRH